MLEANEILANKISKLSNLMNKKDEVCLIKKYDHLINYLNHLYLGTKRRKRTSTRSSKTKTIARLLKNLTIPFKHCF